MNEIQVKQKAVSLEGLLMLDNGKSPGESFPGFSFEVKIRRFSFGCGSWHACCSYLPKGQRWQCLPSSRFPRWVNVVSYGGLSYHLVGSLKQISRDTESTAV